MRKTALMATLLLLATSSGCTQIVNWMGLKAYPVWSVVKWIVTGMPGIF